MSTYPFISNCIAASAGTGKTYRLVSRYIALLCLGARPDSLVALTFTNKAAGEFRNRIMEALANGARFSPSEKTPRNPLAARVVETIFGRQGNSEDPAETIPLIAGADPALLETAAQRGVFPEELPEVREILGHNLDAAYFCSLLESMVQQMCSLQLSTMDSFFQKLVTRHAVEIGVGVVRPLMGEEEAAACRQAMLAMAGQHDVSAPRRTAFIELCRNIYDDKVKSVVEKLLKEVKKNLSLLENHADRNDWQSFGAFNLPDVSETEALAHDEWESLEARYNELLGQVITDFKPNSHPHQGVMGFLKKMGKRDFRLSHVDKYLNSSDFHGRLHDELKKLIREMRNRMWQELLRSTEAKTKGMFELLDMFSKSFRDAVVSTGRMSFAEMTRQSAQLLESGAAEELNQRFKHWMLDEFQDTNTPQWEALRCLLDEVVQENESSADYRHKGKVYKASERSLFVVGDRKQGIYAFRGTNGVLFSMLHGDTPPIKPEDSAYQDVLVPSSLSLSYRSARAIMGGTRKGPKVDGFVNSLFRNIGDDGLAEFYRHDTTRKSRGYVQVRILREEENAADLRGNIMPEAIKDILTGELTEGGEALKEGMTVAVLVRTNEEAKAIVHFLHGCLPKLPVQLVGTSEVAAASPLGELLTSLFLWLRHPADTYRKNIVKLSPIGKLWQGEESDADAYARWIQMLDARGYAAVVRDVIIPLFPGCEHARTFDEWLAAAVEFDIKGGSLDEWLEFMAQRSVKDAATTRAVQVMTMHKSKGLQFDAVIIPYIGENPVDSTADLNVLEKGNAVLVSPGDEGRRAAFENELYEPMEDWKAARCQEAYNLMYVAITRAKYANYILLRRCVHLEYKKNPETKAPELEASVISNSEAGLITRALFGGGKVREGSEEFKKLTATGVVYEQGGRSWYLELLADREEKRRAAEMDEDESDDQSYEPAKSLGQAVERRRKVSPSKLAEEEGGRAPAPAYIPPLDSSEYGDGRTAADFGTAVHALFEQVEWLDGAPLPFAPADSPEAAIVCSALQEPAIAALFHRNGNQAAFNEQDIDAIDSLNSREVWVSGTIDRLVLTMQGGTVTTASIIDFKTDKRRGTTPQEQDDALRERHFPQMKAYHNLVCNAFNLPPDKVTVTLVSCPSDGAPPRAIPYGAQPCST